MQQRFRKFLVRLPSGARYWTVIDSSFRPVSVVDEWLLHMRMGRDAAESTTEAYATSVALFFQWCQGIGLDWRAAPSHLARFVLWLRHYSADEPAGGGSAREVRGARRINAVTAAVREFFKHAVSIRLVEPHVLDALYDLVEEYELPVDVRGERATRLRSRPRHRLSEPDRLAEVATDEEVLALLAACRNARDRFIVLALWRVGNRRGELTGLRMEDAHFLPDSSVLGCRRMGPHLHVCRRDNSNRATAKSRRSRVVPVDWLMVQAFDQYLLLRNECAPASRCDFLLVNLFRGPIGGPMRPRALNELLAALSRRAGLSRPVHPHMLRHGFGTNLAASGSTLDEIQQLMGHAFATSSQVYLHPSAERLRQAVERVGTPRGLTAGHRP